LISYDPVSGVSGSYRLPSSDGLGFYSSLLDSLSHSPGDLNIPPMVEALNGLFQESLPGIVSVVILHAIHYIFTVIGIYGDVRQIIMTEVMGRDGDDHIRSAAVGTI
jgi:hypothetical protein